MHYLRLATLAESSGSTSECLAEKYKFKVKQVSVGIDDYIRIFGAEDEDRLLINTSYVVQSEASLEMDEIKLIVRDDNIYAEIFIKKYLPRIDSRLDEILQSKSNLIITEGKTDWIHLKHALKKTTKSR